MLAAPLSYCSIFPLNAAAFGFCVEGCELSIGGAASLLSKIAELWSLLDCVGSNGFHEPLVVSGIINHCFAGISSVSCSHVGEPNVHSDPTHIGHEYCVSGCSGSVCSNANVVNSPCSDMSSISGRSVWPLTWGQDRFEVPSFCQLLCNHGPSRRSRRSSLAGLCSDSVGGVADASSSRHSSLACSPSSGFSISDFIFVGGSCVCSLPSISCLVSESAPPEYHVCVCFCFARSCCVSACSSACVGALDRKSVV